ARADEEGQIDALVPRTPCVNATPQWKQFAGSAPADPPEPPSEAPPTFAVPTLDAPPVEISPALPPELVPAVAPPPSSWITRTLDLEEHATSEAIAQRTEPHREPKRTSTG